MSTILDYDAMALIQKSKLVQPGPYGNQQNSPSNDSFNTAVGIGVGLSGAAKMLQSQPPAPPSYKRTDDNYILTELEKQAIDSKCKQLAAAGVVPLDSLTTFFYILAATTSLNDLVFIGDVIGVPELGDQRYVRNIRGVCDIPDIYKVGYLSQGISSVNQRFASKYVNVRSVADPYRSSYGQIQQGLDISQQLGVIGPIILSVANQLNDKGGILSNAPSLSSSSIQQAVGLFSGMSGGSTAAGFSPTQIQSILNPSATLSNNLLMAGQGALQSLLGSSPLGGALGALGALGGIGLGSLLGQSGGNAMGSFMSEMMTGKRLKTCQLSKNPMLTPPSYAGKAYFGEAPFALPALDQVFCRKVGSFGTTQGGGGVVSFGMQNFASFGGGMSVASMVSKMVTGTPTVPDPGTFYGDMVGKQIENVANVLNVKTTDTIEPRRSDNSIPFMIGMSSTIVGEKFSPFGSGTFSDSWKLAASTANEIQKVNPQFLATCKSSL
jgi:hypothetical protein